MVRLRLVRPLGRSRRRLVALRMRQAQRLVHLLDRARRQLVVLPMLRVRQALQVLLHRTLPLRPTQCALRPMAPPTLQPLVASGIFFVELTLRALNYRETLVLRRESRALTNGFQTSLASVIPQPTVTGSALVVLQATLNPPLRRRSLSQTLWAFGG
ncbi:hypothetical protein IWX50DRAFT_624318 [Phyllosticta citricarpa]